MARLDRTYNKHANLQTTESFDCGSEIVNVNLWQQGALESFK